MGLDMELYGRKSSLDNDEDMDNFRISGIDLEIGYWRKHPNLHGYIVDTFADGNDDCQKILLEADDLSKIIEALENDALYDEPVTGFFFGRSYFPGEKNEWYSYEEQKANDIDIFTKALNWLTDNRTSNECRSVYYQASW